MVTNVVARKSSGSLSASTAAERNSTPIVTARRRTDEVTGRMLSSALITVREPSARSLRQVSPGGPRRSSGG